MFLSRNIEVDPMALLAKFIFLSGQRERTEDRETVWPRGELIITQTVLVSIILPLFDLNRVKLPLIKKYTVVHRGL